MVHSYSMHAGCGQSVAVAIRLLQMTAAAGHFLQENRLYKSHRLLQRVTEALPATDDAEEPGNRCGHVPLLECFRCCPFLC